MANLSDNLVDLIRVYLTPEVVDNAASFLGENRVATESAINTAVPALLSAFSSYADKKNGASQLFDLVNQFQTGDLTQLASTLFQQNSKTESLINSGKTLLDTILGNKKIEFIDQFAKLSGMKSLSVVSLLSLLANYILGFLSKHISALGLNASALAKLLSEQSHRFFNRMLPAGLGTLLGLDGNLAEDVKKATELFTGEAEEEKRGLLSWLLPLLLLGAVIWAITMMRGCKQSELDTQVEKIGGALSSITLPDGALLSLRQGGFNYNLVEFLKNASDTVVPRTFVFDDLNFQFATTTLTAESKKTVDDLAAILKAFPSTEVRLEGHTDNVGDAASNIQLSQDRANAIKEMLTAKGISPFRMNTAGFGQNRPIDSNETEAGRAKNRRTELVVVKK